MPITEIIIVFIYRWEIKLSCANLLSFLEINAFFIVPFDEFFLNISDNCRPISYEIWNFGFLDFSERFGNPSASRIRCLVKTFWLQKTTETHRQTFTRINGNYIILFIFWWSVNFLMEYLEKTTAELFILCLVKTG